MKESEENPPYDLEERTYLFAKDVRRFIKILERSLANLEDARQLVRSSGSVAANYIEANEALSKEDFVMRIKISRKEAKESALWLRLLDADQPSTTSGERDRLLGEARELMKIFGAIYRKSSGDQ